MPISIFNKSCYETKHPWFYVTRVSDKKELFYKYNSWLRIVIKILVSAVEITTID
jgi:hypothetical protein